MCTDMKSVYTDFIDWLIFSGHQFVFSVHQSLKISVSRYTDFQKLMCPEFIDWLIFSGHRFVFGVHQFLRISASRYTDFQKLVYTDYFQWTPVCFQCTPIFENQCEQIH